MLVPKITDFISAERIAKEIMPKNCQQKSDGKIEF
jgi:hypothetical protein